MSVDQIMLRDYKNAERCLIAPDIKRSPLKRRGDSLTIRFPPDLVLAFDSLVRDHKYKSVSDAIRDLARTGLAIQGLKTIAGDPAQAEKVRQAVTKAVEDNTLFQWVESMNNNQLDAIKFTLDCEATKRYEQSRFAH